MKKLTAILSLLCLVFTLAGFTVAFRIRLQMVKQEMRNLIRKNAYPDDLSRFHFTPDQYASLDWEEDNEFTLNGQVYDVIKIVHGKEVVSITCIADKREQELTDNYHKQQQQQQSRDLVNMFKQINASFVQTAIGISPVNKPTKKPYSFYTCPPVIKRELLILTPPPDVC